MSHSLTCVRRLKVHDPDQAFATEPQRQKLLDLLVQSALESDLARSALKLGPRDLVRRYLPPGTWTDIYHLYLSFQGAKNMRCSSATTFFRVVRKSGWKKVLRFRPVSTHTACPTCQRLKAQLRHANDVATHARYADKLMRHLQGQFMDRQVYWDLRSRAKRDADIIVCIQDSMDKGKFALPKFVDGRVPKHLATLNRPVLEVTANIVHGRLIYIGIADEGQNAGSSWSLEVLSRALDKAYLQAQRNNLTWPPALKIWSDNTPKDTWELALDSKVCFDSFRASCHMSPCHWHCRSKEIKNGVLGNWCSAAASIGIFHHISYEQLVVGHTHEDIGTSTESWIDLKWVDGLVHCYILHAWVSICFWDAFFGVLCKYIRCGDDKVHFGSIDLRGGLSS